MTFEIDEDSKKRRNTMSTTEVVKSSKEYMNVPIAELIESSTNPRKVFDQSFLEELAESIRNKGILSPLLVRPVNNHLEIVAGAQRYRAAKLAGLEVAPIRLKAMTDLEAQEAQQIENVQRKDVHPFEEAQGYRTLLGFEGANYTIEKLAARIGKRPQRRGRKAKAVGLDRSSSKRIRRRTHRLESCVAHCQARSGRAGEGIGALLRRLLRRERCRPEPRARQPLAGVDSAEHLPQSQIRSVLEGR
jgi:ParB/RepB/Spo0J family partition protein